VRRFTARHEYRRAGVYSPSVTLIRAGKRVRTAHIRITVRAGVGERDYY
jgi:hypothetical protein